DYCVLADQIDAADVAVEIYAHAGPIEFGRHLLDLRGFAGTMLAGAYYAAVLSQARTNVECGWAIVTIVSVNIRHVCIALRMSPSSEMPVYSEDVPNRRFHLGQAGNLLHCGGH